MTPKIYKCQFHLNEAILVKKILNTFLSYPTASITLVRNGTNFYEDLYKPCIWSRNEKKQTGLRSFDNQKMYSIILAFLCT